MPRLQKFHNLFINSLLFFTFFSQIQNMILHEQSFTVYRRQLAQQSVFNYLVTLDDVDIQEELQQKQKNINHVFKDRILNKQFKYDEQSHTTVQRHRQNNKYDEISHVTRQQKKQNGFKYDEQSHTTRKFKGGLQPSQNTNGLYIQGRSINKQFDEQSANTINPKQQNRTKTNQNNLNIPRQNQYDEISSVTQKNSQNVSRNQRNQFDEVSALTMNQQKKQQYDDISSVTQNNLQSNSRNQINKFDEVSGLTINQQKQFDDISSVTKQKVNQSVNKNQDVSYTTQRNNQQLNIELKNVSKSFLTYFNYYKQQNPQNQGRANIVKHLSNFTLKKSEEKIKYLIESLFADFKNKSNLTFKLQVHVYEKLYENNQFVSQQIMKEEPIELKIELPFYKQQIKKIEFLINQAQPWLNHYYEHKDQDQYEEKINQKLKLNQFFTRRNKLEFKANWMDFQKGTLQIMIQATVPFQDEDFMNYKRGTTVFDDGRYLIE